MNNCEECNIRLSKYVEMFKANTEESAKYTSLIFSLGYVSFFSIINIVCKLLPKIFLIAAIILMLISLVSFIILEIYGMWLRAEYNKIQVKNWNSYFEGEKTLFELEKANIQESINLYKLYRLFYPFSFWISVITGFTSIGIVFYYLFRYFLEL